MGVNRITSRGALCILAGLLGTTRVLPAAPTTQPADAEQPATTQPADLSPEAQSAERHKNADPKWVQFQRQQRSRARDHWPSLAPAATLKPDALVHLKLSGDLLAAQVADLNPGTMVRVAVEGSDATWTYMRPRPPVFGGPVGLINPAHMTYINRFDLDAKDEEAWTSRLAVSPQALTLSSQSIFDAASLSQSGGTVTLIVNEFTQWGQPPLNLLTARAASLPQLRAEHPAEFRQYALPLIEKFTAESFLIPGAADVYAVFTEVPADVKVTDQIEALLPDLDSDNPADRAAASARLTELGAPGVLAAMRLDPSGLSEEQKNRLRRFVATYSRRSIPDPLVARRDAGFLADSLEFEDPAVRAAARGDIEKRLGHPIPFDPAQTGEPAARAVDEIRKQLLPPPPPPSTAPATLPSPQA